MNDVYIPCSSYAHRQVRGSLAAMSAADMGVVAAKAAIERAGIRSEQIEETIFGNARQAGGGPMLPGRFPYAAASRKKFPLTRLTRPARRE